MNNDEYEFVAGKLEINHSMSDSCTVTNIQPQFMALQGLVGKKVNLSELQFLMRRLDSFNPYELKQFHAVVLMESAETVRDMINATYNLSEYTVIDEMKDLEYVGKRNYMDIHIGISVEEAEKIDFEEFGRNLLNSQNGIVRSMGILFKNDVELQKTYQGRTFPEFISSDKDMVMVYVKHGMEQEPLYLPSTPFLLKCAVERAGGTMDDFEIVEGDNLGLPEEIYQICIQDLNLNNINEFCQTVCYMDKEHWKTMKVIACYKELGEVMELTSLARNINEFQILESITDPGSLGRYMVEELGDYVANQELWPYIDYCSFGEMLIEDMEGEFFFTDFGAVDGKIRLEKALDYKGEFQMPLIEEAAGFTNLTLFTPLKVAVHEDGMYEDPVELNSYDILEVQSDIEHALKIENMTLNPYRGLMEHFHRSRPVAGKVFSAFPGVREKNGILYGVLECQIREPLTEKELITLKDYWSGQAADGYGEGFEQREIASEKGILSVYLWNTDSDYTVMTEEELDRELSQHSGQSHQMCGRSQKERKMNE